MLNNLDWKFNTLCLSDFVNFFISKTEEQHKNVFKSKTFLLFIDFFIECVLSSFISSFIPFHALSLCIILLAYDQYLTLNKEEIDGTDVCLSILKNADEQLKIDLIQVDFFKKKVIECIKKELPEIKLNSIYPDERIQNILEKNKTKTSFYSADTKEKKIKHELCQCNILEMTERDELGHSGSKFSAKDYKEDLMSDCKLSFYSEHQLLCKKANSMKLLRTKFQEDNY